MKRYRIVEDSIKKGTCSKCRRSNTFLVKVIDTKTDKTEWRCNKCVRKLSEDKEKHIAYKLSDLNIKEMKKQLERKIRNEEIKQRNREARIVKVNKNEVLDKIKDIKVMAGNLNKTLKNSQLNDYAYLLEPSFDVLRTLSIAIERDYPIKKGRRENILHWIMKNEVLLHFFRQYDLDINNLNIETVPNGFKLTGKHPQITSGRTSINEEGKIMYGGIGAPRADLYLSTKNNQRFWIEIETRIKGIEKDVRYAEKYQNKYDKFFVCLPKDELYNKFHILWNIDVKLPHPLIGVLLYDKESKEISNIVNHKELLKGLGDLWSETQKLTDKEKSKARK